MAKLSGGERNRLHLARQLLRGGNFLVLDEPTNDLDLYTLRVLEETIDAFDGCAMIVSHDRYFLNRVCTHMWIFEGDGVVSQITGNYDDYLLYRQRRKQEASEEARAARREVASKAASKPSDGPRKLTWKEKNELAGMETAILEAEEAAASIEERIQAPGFYEQDHAKVQAELGALQEAQATVEALYERWSELEELAG
jgi:ATP-binding cassette subfamily F protein uup